MWQECQRNSEFSPSITSQCAFNTPRNKNWFIPRIKHLCTSWVMCVQLNVVRTARIYTVHKRDKQQLHKHMAWQRTANTLAILSCARKGTLFEDAKVHVLDRKDREREFERGIMKTVCQTESTICEQRWWHRTPVFSRLQSRNPFPDVCTYIHTYIHVTLTTYMMAEWVNNIWDHFQLRQTS